MWGPRTKSVDPHDLNGIGYLLEVSKVDAAIRMRDVIDDLEWEDTQIFGAVLADLAVKRHVGISRVAGFGHMLL